VLTREQFFAVKVPAFREVKVPALGGGSVFIRPMTAGERDAFDVAHSADGRSNFRARVVVASACDQLGNRLFTAADIPRLSELPAYALNPIVEAAEAVNLFSDADVDELEKN
jgi:xanthine/CO dehydrogenase XdhC/CoxF family maturation factor